MSWLKWVNECDGDDDDDDDGDDGNDEDDDEDSDDDTDEIIPCDAANEFLVAVGDNNGDLSSTGRLKVLFSPSTLVWLLWWSDGNINDDDDDGGDVDDLPAAIPWYLLDPLCSVVADDIGIAVLLMVFVMTSFCVGRLRPMFWFSLTSDC